MDNSAMLSKVGHVAVSWNEAEQIINQILWLYLETDRRTADVLTKPMRPSDREKLLKELIKIKEIDPTVSEEILEALRICSICRENRNSVLHRSFGNPIEPSSKALAAVSTMCREFDEALLYLRSLQEAVTKVIYERLSREPPIGDESSDDELLPLAEFARPTRPKRPRKFNPEELFQNG